MKKVISLLLAVAMIMTALSALAADGITLYAVPTAEKIIPQSEALGNLGKHWGRNQPATANSRPVVDPMLPTFRPAYSVEELSGSRIMKCSDVLAYICHDYIDAFQTIYPNVDIQLDEPYVGSAGAAELIAGAVDLVMVSREPRPNEYPDFKAAFGYDFTAIPVQGGTYDYFGWLDGMCFIVNKDNPIEYITMSQIDSIFSTSLYHCDKASETWGDLGLTGEWADKPIERYAITHWNGFEEFIRIRCLDKRDGQAASNLYATQGTWREDMHFEKKVFNQALRIKEDPCGIAYTGIAYVDEDVKVLPIMLDDGTIIPCNYESFCNGSWPLARLCYLNYNKAPDGEWDPIVKEFLRFLLSSDAAAICAEQNLYIPLTAAQANSARDTAGLEHEDYVVTFNGNAIKTESVSNFYSYANGLREAYMVPLLDTMNALGCTFTFDEVENRYDITCGDLKSTLYIGAGYVVVNDVEHKLSINSKTWNGTVYMPADGICLITGADYVSDDDARIINFTR